MLSRKNSRLIDVEGQKYRWSISGDSGYNVLIVQSAEENGQRLEVITSLAGDAPITSITPSFVAQTIQDALKLGWAPKLKASPLELTRDADKSLRVRRGLTTD